MKTCNKFLIALIFIFYTAAQISAATLVWDGGGDGFSFGDPLNWNTNTVPTSSDVTEITSANVVINNSIDVAAIHLMGTAFLTINKGVTVNFLNMTGGGVGDIMELDNDSRAVNRGSMLFDDNDMSICIDLDDNSTFENFGIIEINGRGTLFIALQTDSENTSFTNNSNARFQAKGTDFILIQNDGPVTNHGEMILQDFAFIGIQLDAFNPSNTGVFTNTGNLELYTDSLNVNEYIDIRNDNELRNSGTISFSGPLDSVRAIEFSGSGVNSLINEACGIINIESQAYFDLNSENALLTNDGVIASAFTRNNTNDGTIINNGRIQTTSGSFGLMGTGTFNNNGEVIMGDVPTNEPLLPECIVQIPTLSQWGLIILALLLFITGATFYNIYLERPILYK